MTKFSLTNLGWKSDFESEFKHYQQNGFDVGRVSIENRDNYQIITKDGEMTAEATGKLLFSAQSSSDLPKVGDWVVITMFKQQKRAIIHDILPRKTKFSRGVAGKKIDEQIIATNIDFIFIVQSLDKNYNLNRLERYIVMVHNGKSKPIVILNKTDLCNDVKKFVDQTKNVIKDVPILHLSAKTGNGLESLKSMIKAGKTYAFIGSSGVGKSTLINKLIGDDILKTNEVRGKDSKGRHTTSRRELIVLDEGGLLIDTPGMRELQLWDSNQGLEDTFSDFTQIAENCHFSDCTHTGEKKCAVLSAVEAGDIPIEHYENYIKLQKEAAFLEARQNDKSYYIKKKKWKNIHKAMKKFNKDRGK